MSNPSIPSANMVETYTGQFVDTRAPDASTICLEDIAHALANVCRYGGHCRTFYSVAEHSVCVSIRLQRRGHGPLRQLGGLLHDGSEAYLGDIPRPLKPLLGAGYRRLTERMDKAIIRGLALPFDVDMFHDVAVKTADNWALFVEARHLLPSRGINWAGSQLEAWNIEDQGRIVTPDYFLGGLSPVEAERLFLARYTELVATND